MNTIDKQTIEGPRDKKRAALLTHPQVMCLCFFLFLSSFSLRVEDRHRKGIER